MESLESTGRVSSPAASVRPGIERKEFELDDDIGLTSPSLRSMLSYKQPVSDLEDTAAPTITAANVGVEMQDRESSEDDWENM